jgi:hypothetical protein
LKLNSLNLKVKDDTDVVYHGLSISKGLREYDLIEWEVHQIMGIGPFSLEVMEAQFASTREWNRKS